MSKVRITSEHSFTEGAKPFKDFAFTLEGVTAISPGIISKVKPGGKRHVKIIEDKGAILLKIRGYNSIQEVRIYGLADKLQTIKLALSSFITKSGFQLKFRGKNGAIQTIRSK